jgi:heptose-I-phosphate ethanolaminephosphotransferase
MLLLYAASMFIFLHFNHGLAPTSRRQQERRYLLAVLLSGIALWMTNFDVWSPQVVAALVVCVAWMLTWNITYHLTNRRRSPDYDNHIDIAFALYLFGFLVGLNYLISLWSQVTAGIVCGAIESVLLLIPVAEAGYYIIYKVCIDTSGMQPLLETNGNEILEFIHSFSFWKVLAMIVPLIATVALCFGLNLAPAVTVEPFVRTGCIDPFTGILLLFGDFILMGFMVFFAIYLFKPHHGLFVRTGIVELYRDVRAYQRSNANYRQDVKTRFNNLKVGLPAGGLPTPHTILLVIGESACRDYMSCYVPQPFETTPWESHKLQTDPHFIFFTHAYSCAMQTVPSLSRALTEKNLYNDMNFGDACTIVDIAHKAGYRVSWYSNQGHIDSNDTPVTLIAETADVAKWTKQEIGKPYYDESLLEFLDEVNPNVNNLVVLHLKGSHFNYQNRYTPEYAAVHDLTNGDNVQNYRNSIHYTDHILHSAYHYAKYKLHLAAMVYFSDHGAIPEKRRLPWFLGYGMVRIPMWIYLSDEYRQTFPTTTSTLETNKNKYFTNDLAYDLFCGLLNIKSDHYDESQSLASPRYRFTRDMLLTDEGRVRVEKDSLS